MFLKLFSLLLPPMSFFKIFSPNQLPFPWNLNTPDMLYVCLCKKYQYAYNTWKE